MGRAEIRRLTDAELVAIRDDKNPAGSWGLEWAFAVEEINARAAEIIAAGRELEPA